MSSLSDDHVSSAILEMRDLLRVLAEPAMAERYKKHSAEIRRITGDSGPKAKAAILMNGTNSQAGIVKIVGIHKGQLSEFVRSLGVANLLVGDPKLPQLLIKLPPAFFEKGIDDAG